MRILLIESGHRIEQQMAARLRCAGCALDHATQMSTGINMAGAYPYDAFIVVLGQHESLQDGLKFVRHLRDQRNHLPIMLITSKPSLNDLVEAFNCGADEYLVKPFDALELEVRLKALMRRCRATPANLLTCGGFCIDFFSRMVTREGEVVHLTAKEYGVLELLTSYPGRIFTRQEITDRVWDEHFAAVTNIVDVYIKNLRRKIGDRHIETVRGLGYRLVLSNAA